MLRHILHKVLHQCRLLCHPNSCLFRHDLHHLHKLLYVYRHCCMTIHHMSDQFQEFLRYNYLRIGMYMSFHRLFRILRELSPRQHIRGRWLQECMRHHKQHIRQAPCMWDCHHYNFVKHFVCHNPLNKLQCEFRFRCMSNQSIHVDMYQG